MDEPVHSGKVFGGRYAIGARLGAGGWGAVYAAVQTDLGRPVAIKVLHTTVALERDGLARFEREARAAAALGHPNIAQVSDFQANPNEPPFLVMELLTGATLGAALKGAPSRKIAPARMVWIAYQILAGLDVAHRAGIVHRDIKPDNVFLVAMAGVEDHVKLLDFGIAKLSGGADAQLTSTGTMLGSPAFMAPEQVRSSDVDHRVDLYAVGATMYLALTGRMPFDATTMHGLLLAITEQRVVPLHELDPSIDPALSAVVARAMHKDRDGRFPTAEAMRHALEPWLGGTAAHASATANGPRMISPASIATSALAQSGPSYGAPPTVPNAPPPMMSTSPQYYQGTAPHVASVTPQYGSPPGPMGPPPGSAPAGQPMPQAFTPPPVFSPTPAPAAAPAKSNGAVVVLLVAVVGLLVVLIGGGGAAWYFFARREVAAIPVGAPGTTPPGAAAAAAPSNAAAAGSTTTAATAAGAAPAAGAVAGKPRASTAATTPAAPGAAPVPVAPGSPAAPAAPGAVPPPATGAKKQFAGSSFRFGGGSFGVFDIEASKAAINRAAGGINACYAATEFDAPDHQFTNWTFQVDPAGNVKSVRRSSDADPHPKFDGCMIGALRQIKWPTTPSGGSPQVALTSRTRDNP